METKEFIEKTNNIVKFLVNAAGQDNYIAAARIVTKQAEMDFDSTYRFNENINYLNLNETQLNKIIEESIRNVIKKY